MIVHRPIAHLFLQWQCIYAAQIDDPHCFDHRDQIRRWGRMIWPCRAFVIDVDDQDDGQRQYEVGIIRISKLRRRIARYW